MTIQVNALCKMGPVLSASSLHGGKKDLYLSDFSFHGGKKDLYLSAILWESQQARPLSNLVEC